MNNLELLLNTPMFQKMDAKKKEFLRTFLTKEKPASFRDALPFLLANINSARNQNISFSASEVELLTNVLASNASPEEKKKIKKIMEIFNQKKPT